jgi:hypothetical protein
MLPGNNSLKDFVVDVEFNIRRGPLDIQPITILIPVTFPQFCQIAQAFGFKPKILEASDTFDPHAPDPPGMAVAGAAFARGQIANEFARAARIDEVFEAVPERPDLRRVSYRTMVFFREGPETVDQIEVAKDEVPPLQQTVPDSSAV